MSERNIVNIIQSNPRVIVVRAAGIQASGSGSGDVVGPASSTDNGIARFDGTTGKLIQNSAVTIADTTGDITGGKYNSVAISGSSTPTLSVTGTSSISGSNTGDNAVNSLYSGLVSNATHTGEVTGSTSLTVDKTAITNKTQVTAVGTDYILISDTSDSGNLKKALASDLTGSGSAAWGSITGTLSNQTDLQNALDGKVDENGAITGATKTKITYDAKGLVTSGADATTADIADSSNRRYVTDAQLAVIGNTSGTNTGDQTNITGNAATVTTNANLTGPITSVGNATSIASQTGTGTTFAMSASPTFTGSPLAPTQSANDNSTKIATTAYADAKVADAINNGTTTIAPSQNAVFDALALKQDLDAQLTSLAGLSYTGNSLKVVRVNAGETDFELATVSGGGGGISRSINSVSGTTSAGSTANTDYVYLCSGTFTITLPTAVGNTNLYTIKNVGTGIITIATTSSQTIDGVTTQVLPTQYGSVGIVSDNSNWSLVES